MVFISWVELSIIILFYKLLPNPTAQKEGNNFRVSSTIFTDFIDSIDFVGIFDYNIKLFFL